MTLGDKIRKYRTLKGLTQAQLGSMVKLTGDRIRQYENDVRKPKDGKLFEIADALDVNPSTLAEPDFDDPTSVMHVLFELEDIYGLHFEKRTLQRQQLQGEPRWSEQPHICGAT